jgi:vitamin B12 transporter
MKDVNRSIHPANRTTVVKPIGNLFKNAYMRALALASVLLLFTSWLPDAWAEQEKIPAAPFFLEEVVVTASRVEEKKKEVSANVTTITETEIQNSPSRNLGDLLAEKGIGHVQKYPGALTTIGIRGFRTETHGNDLMGKVLLLVDGRRAGTGNLAKIMTDNIERIEIIRGPASVQYGSAAMGGVVNVITKRGKGKPAFFAEGGLGSWGYEKEGVGLSGKISDFDFSGSFAHREMDDYDTATGATYHNTGYERQEDASVNIGYEFYPGNRIGLIYHDYSAGGVGGSGYFKTNDLDNYKDSSNESVDLVYEGRTVDGPFSWEIRYFDGKDKDKWVDPVASNASGWDDGIPYEQKTDHRGTAAQFTYDKGLLFLTTGINWDNYKIESTSDPKESEYDNPAGYLLAKVRLFDKKLILSGGARYDEYEVKMKNPAGREESDRHLSPRAGIVWLLNDYLKWRANYGEAFRMPSAEEMAYDVWGWGAHTVGNPDLKPEKSSTWETGFDFAWNALATSVTWFHTDFKDKIQSVAKPGAINTWENIGEATIEGFEGEISYDIGALFSWDLEVKPYLSFTHLTKYDDDETGKELFYTEGENVSYGISVSHPDDFSARLNFTYTGKKWIDDWENAGPPTWVAPKIEEGGFTVADLTLSKKLFDFKKYGGITLKGEIQNLFDKDYHYVKGYPMPGRSFYLGMRYDF